MYFLLGLVALLLATVAVQYKFRFVLYSAFKNQYGLGLLPPHFQFAKVFPYEYVHDPSDPCPTRPAKTPTSGSRHGLSPRKRARSPVVRTLDFH